MKLTCKATVPLTIGIGTQYLTSVQYLLRGICSRWLRSLLGWNSISAFTSAYTVSDNNMWTWWRDNCYL